MLTFAVAKGQSPKQATWGKPVELTLLQGLNSTALDFSAVPFNKGIIFTSNRNAAKGNVFDETEKIFCTDLYYADRKGFGQYGDAKPLEGKVNTAYHEGVGSMMPGIVGWRRRADAVSGQIDALECGEQRRRSVPPGGRCS